MFYMYEVKSNQMRLFGYLFPSHSDVGIRPLLKTTGTIPNRPKTKDMN